MSFSNAAFVILTLSLIQSQLGESFLPPLPACHHDHPHLALGNPAFQNRKTIQLFALQTHSRDRLTMNFEHDFLGTTRAIVSTVAALAPTLIALPFAAEATSSILITQIEPAILLSAVCSYAHIFSILGILGCLVAERVLVSTEMTPDDEDAIVKIDVLYGVLAMLLIGSGFARAATTLEKGGDFYIHESTFWVKMFVAGVWGGLSLFPSLTFYKRKDQRATTALAAVEEPVNPSKLPRSSKPTATSPSSTSSGPMPISDTLVDRLHSIIQVEIAAILTIPLLASLMGRGVGYSSDFPWQTGVAASLVATGGSFFYYGRQALTWDNVPKKDTEQLEKDRQSEWNLKSSE